MDETARRRVRRRFPDGEPISALTGQGLDALGARIAGALPPRGARLRLLVPFDRPEVLAWLHREAEVAWSERSDAGTMVMALVPERHLGTVAAYVQAPATARRARR